MRFIFFVNYIDVFNFFLNWLDVLYFWLNCVKKKKNLVRHHKMQIKSLKLYSCITKTGLFIFVTT